MQSIGAIWRIELLGWLRCSRPDRTITRFRTHKTGALLAFLAFHHHRSHPRECLIERFWPEREPAAGRDSLSTALVWLRRQLEPPDAPGGVILADRASVRLNPAACVFDFQQFEATVAAGMATDRVPERLALLAQAVDLCHGELLPGYFDDWIVPERLRLADLLHAVLQQLAAGLEQAGDLPLGLSSAHRGVGFTPRGVDDSASPRARAALNNEQALREKLATRTAELRVLRKEVARLRRQLSSS